MTTGFLFQLSVLNEMSTGGPRIFTFVMLVAYFTTFIRYRKAESVRRRELIYSEPSLFLMSLAGNDTSFVLLNLDF
ncbi:uncharacterized protein EAE97_011325 [Botrytis byssoidea]|uniref:Uncharacterized protein n=1 Tax=Botrytis byssoidea TaxID=139641 RepID=A0A9P5HXS9_9HELO|nr:uncharacterized protein EAE97_011325 [Botrytis byssoidea]KAF7921057.1 hypothetical protein EAE97_011325 [Botrytis byssoidea]